MGQNCMIVFTCKCKGQSLKQYYIFSNLIRSPILIGNFDLLITTALRILRRECILDALFSLLWQQILFCIWFQNLKHNPNGRFVVVCGDGEYIIYTALAWRNRSFGSALEFVWSSDGEYAVRETTSKIKIFSKTFQVWKLLKYIIRWSTLMDFRNWLLMSLLWEQLLLCCLFLLGNICSPEAFSLVVKGTALAMWGQDMLNSLVH